MKTKIVATIGPASKDRVTLENMIEAGLDVARFNFSHGKESEFQNWTDVLREISKEKSQPICIIQDLQGPRIRVGKLSQPVEVKKDQQIKIVKEGEGSKDDLPLIYSTLDKDIKENDRILIDSGQIELKVSGRERNGIKAKVIVGGKIEEHKGVNLPDTNISLPFISKKDEKDLQFGIKNDLDYLVFSFVRTGQDIYQARKLVNQKGGKDIKIIAKIETQEGLNNIEEIIEESDGIMIGRGDLGIEIPIEEVPIAQKKIIQLAREAGIPVITATQMLSSMVENPQPTRAEVSDIANAILDGTDAVMLSEEASIGKYPVEAVQQMNKIIGGTEDDLVQKNDSCQTKNKVKAVGANACLLAQQLEARYIISATASGFTAQMIAQHRPHTPIIAYTSNQKTYQQLALIWGVEAKMTPNYQTTDEFIFQIIENLKTADRVKKGDYIIITAGHPVGRKGTTNLIKVQKI